jgi:hypothetical protein
MAADSLLLGENRFIVPPLPAMRSFALQARIAPALTEVAKGFGALKEGLDGDVTAIAPAIAGFFAKLGADELEAIAKTLLADATMDGKALFTPSGNPFDVHMRGRTMDTWKLLWFAIEVNYPDFFKALGGGVKAEGKEASKSKESTISPGHAGASL